MCFVASLLVMPVLGTNSNNAAEARPLVQSFRMPDTPFLPPYKGRIVTGAYSAKPQSDGGIAYSITFEAAEQPAQVLNWYKAAFQLYDWKQENDSSAQYRLAAQHGSNVNTQIFLMSPRKAGAATQVQLYYRYVGTDI